MAPDNAKHRGLYRLSDEERAGIERGLRVLRERRFACDERMAEVFRRARNPGAREPDLASPRTK
jgi:hypothetical protein